MIMIQDLLNVTQVRNDFSQFVDKVLFEKPQAVKRNRDVFWSISQNVTLELLSGFTFAMESEQEEDGTYVGSLLQVPDIIAYGATQEEMIEDAAQQLVEYAQDYYTNFQRYYHSPNRKSHLPFILNVLTQENLDGVKALIRG
jgi:predicted RNase H-like HicB family nuclease